MDALQLIEWLKTQNITDISEATDIPRDRMYKWVQGKGTPKTEDFNKLLEYWKKSIGSTSNAPTTVGERLRQKKAFTPSYDNGLIYVPIAAQAGYALHYNDNLYLNDLERLYIPGNPFKGDRFRYFEVEGDSMYPTLIEGMQVIAQKIESDYWKQIQNYYIHVIVTQDRILVKRLFRVDDENLMMISDNEDLYPQQELKYSDIKELWLVKRKLDWSMPPPKQFEIKVTKKGGDTSPVKK